MLAAPAAWPANPVRSAQHAAAGDITAQHSTEHRAQRCWKQAGTT
jgi:hypothetical protein